MPSALLFALALAAQAPEPATTVDPLTVTAPNTKAVQGFVGEVVTPAHGSRFTGQVGRWNNPICPMAIGSTREVHAAVVKRIREVALEAGAPLAAARCAPNLAVVVTDNPDEFLKLFSAKRRFTFFGDANRELLAQYMTSDRPVRWWHSIRAEGAAQRGVTSYDKLGGKPRMKLIDSRLETSIQVSFFRALIVIDAAKVKGEGVAPVVDYAAMVALTQVDARRDEAFAVPTILNLFSEGTDETLRPTSLSAADLALLQGLYRTQPNVLFSRQAHLIATRAAAELSER